MPAAYGRPTGTNPRASAQYAPARPQAQETEEDLMANLHAFTSGHNEQVGIQSQGQDPMNQFIHGRGPWVLLNLRDAARGQPASVSFNQYFPSFNGFRTAAPPSEADTVSQSVGIFSDSGYESMARRSVGNPSSYGDADPSFDQHLISSFQGMASVSPQDDARKREARGQRAPAGPPNAKTMVCPDCHAPVKTNSELKKHQARHRKPFRCDVSGCPKATEGFSTNNDLERHKRCVHKQLTGSETVYRCDLDQCKDKPKDWPRQDNFKQHLRRKHQLPEDIDLARFTFRPLAPSGYPGFRPSEDVAAEEAAVMNSDGASQPSWAGLPQTHIDPSDLIKRDARFSRAGNMVSYPGHPASADGDLASMGDETSRYLGQDTPDAVSLHLDLEPTLSDLSMPRPSQEERASATQSYPGDSQPTCVAPEVLSHGPTGVGLLGSLDSQAPPPEVLVLEVEDSYELPRQEDAQSEQEDAEPSVADGMDVDDEPMEDSASEDGADLEDDEAVDDAPNSQYNLPRDTRAQHLADDEAHLKASLSQVQLNVDAPRPVDLDDETQASAVIHSLIQKGKLGDILKKFGYPAPKSVDVQEEKSSANSSRASDNGRGRVKCEECPKTFVRRCELKKHLKRHAKPYACTFAKCTKNFGSKNDWKRHENSQHFQLEIWRCAEKAGADRPDQHQQQQQECGKVCHRRESLKSHLERDHGIQELAVLEKKLADCRMGRNFESRFWCGFCQKTIEPTGKGGPAHSERFDHIDDHFNGRGGLPKADIRDWKHVDTDPVEPSRSSPGKGGGGGSGGGGASRDTALTPSSPSLVMASSTGSNPRKRPRDGDGEASARAKRVKDGRVPRANVAVLWECCSCRGSVGRVELTDQCVGGNGCDHMRCDNCDVFERKIDDLELPQVVSVA
ncbi:hypothetical protein N658DRAFT_240116 [Parathielavia hyrcaniae]|uniref:C2H2-type domain-containing protein n=1 Tax=Parathielavia hyrcaniae TaxID=113614 RepID=A0AAN6QB83_9PEZI|nr:hypothetical protein N658DRAFT_240116 [Parathielavia hyrcaniae]